LNAATARSNFGSILGITLEQHTEAERELIDFLLRKSQPAVNSQWVRFSTATSPARRLVFMTPNASVNCVLIDTTGRSITSMMSVFHTKTNRKKIQVFLGKVQATILVLGGDTYFAVVKGVVVQIEHAADLHI
jgi:hypothetical protein